MTDVANPTNGTQRSSGTCSDKQALAILDYVWARPNLLPNGIPARFIYSRKIAGVKRLSEAVRLLERLAELGYGVIEDVPPPNSSTHQWRYVVLRYRKK